MGASPLPRSPQGSARGSPAARSSLEQATTSGVCPDPMSSGSLSLGAWTDQGVVCGVSGLTPSLSTLAKGLLCA